MFKKLAHAAPLEFLATLRLELARRKLATSRQPLGDIAADVGYQSESAFSRAFRRRFGITPGQARVCPATPFQPCQAHRHADGRHLALVRTGTMHASSFGARPV
jgi:AraC family transcriptional activator of mtrCDE